MPVLPCAISTSHAAECGDILSKWFEAGYIYCEAHFTFTNRGMKNMNSAVCLLVARLGESGGDGDVSVTGNLVGAGGLLEE